MSTHDQVVAGICLLVQKELLRLDAQNSLIQTSKEYIPMYKGVNLLTIPHDELCEKFKKLNLFELREILCLLIPLANTSSGNNKSQNVAINLKIEMRAIEYDIDHKGKQITVLTTENSNLKEEASFYKNQYDQLKSKLGLMMSDVEKK